MIQTSLKVLSGAVSYIDIVLHESLLAAVSLALNSRSISCYYVIVTDFFFQIFKMNLWDYGPDVMDALIELIISLVRLFMITELSLSLSLKFHLTVP